MNKRKLLTSLFLTYVIILVGFGFLYTVYVSSTTATPSPPKDLTTGINELGAALSQSIKQFIDFLLFLVLISSLFYTAAYFFIFRKQALLFLLLPLMNLVIFIPLAYLVNAAITPSPEDSMFFYEHIVFSYLLGSLPFYKWMAAEVDE